jgi:hypothetical protein
MSVETDTCSTGTAAVAARKRKTLTPKLEASVQTVENYASEERKRLKCELPVQKEKRDEKNTIMIMLITYTVGNNFC